MKSFWDKIAEKRNQWTFLAESIQLQKDRIIGILRNKFPSNLVPKIFDILVQFEQQITDAENVRRGQTISKFINTFSYDANTSEAHIIDKLKRELQAEVFKANMKGTKDRKQVAKDQIKIKLPSEPEEVIDALALQVEKGAQIQDVINKFLASKQSVGDDKIIFKQGNYELIEINKWREGSEKEQHLDTKKIEACHPLLAGTKWCVRFQNYFNDYVGSGGALYLVRQNGKPLVLGHASSPWLDTNDDVPDPSMMESVAKFLMNSGNYHAFINAFCYLPDPIRDFEKNKHLFKKNDVDSIKDFVMGEEYTVLENLIVLDSYRDVFEAVNDIMFRVPRRSRDATINSETLQDFVDNMSNETSIGELIGMLNRENEDKIADMLENKYGQDGIEGWDDMDVEEAMHEVRDDEIELLLRQSLDSAIWEDVKKDLTNDMRDPDEVGFYVSSDLKLVIHIENANKYIKGHRGETEFEQMNKRIEIRVSEPDPRINSKIFNTKVAENLK